MSPDHILPPHYLQIGSVETVIVGSWSSVVTILGLLDNLTVLTSSVKYRSVKRDEISLLLIQNLVVADILHLLSGSLPTSVTCFVGRYVLGAAYCAVSAQLTRVAIIAAVLTIIVCARLFHVKM